MKRFIALITAFIVLIVLFSACGSEIESPVLTEDDYPRILGRWQEKEGDKLGEFGTRVGETYSMFVQFTPSNLCEGTWYVDDVEYCKGTVFEYECTTVGTFHIKLIVTTPKYTTSREALLKVNPVN